MPLMTIQTRILERLGWSESAVPLDAWGRVVRGRVEALTGGDAWAYAAVVEEDEAELAAMILEMRKLNPTGKLARVTAIEIVRDAPAR